MKKNLLFLLSVSIIYIVFLFIRKVLINNGYEFLSWVYSCMFLFAFVVIAIETVLFISHFLKGLDRINCSLLAITLEFPIFLILSYNIIYDMDLRHDYVIILEGKKYVESFDISFRPHSVYYNYINCFIRPNKNGIKEFL